MQYGVLLGLALFFGFAFEEFYHESLPSRPGGIRTFPLLAFLGAGLYLVEPRFALAFIAGLIILGAWLFLYVRASLQSTAAPVDGYFVIPTAVVIAYVLGPIALTQPLWVSVAFIVASVLLIGSRKALHAFITRVPSDEALTAGQFLILVGVVLPLLYDAPAIPGTSIKPFSIWLAVVAVSAISYASYLLQRYAFPKRGVVIAGVLGGLYSSTATTVVLSRRARERGFSPDIVAGIIAATGMMYVRILIVCAIFNTLLASTLAIPLLALAVVMGGTAWALARRASAGAEESFEGVNPLQLGAAAVFAILLLGVSIVSAWAQAHLGNTGTFTLAALVGFIDIDPFVLSVAQGGHVATMLAASAILVAASSNNVLKSIYAALFSRNWGAWLPASMLFGASLLGLLIAWVITR